MKLFNAASEVSMFTSVLAKWPYIGVGMRPPFSSGWSAFVEKLICIGGVMEDIPFDLRLVSCGFFQPGTDGGGISVTSIASVSDALAFVEKKLLAVVGCEMLKAERQVRRSSSSTSSSEDSTGVRVGGIEYRPDD
jgi:hypothetical protein